MKLTKENLERYGWLFGQISSDEAVMVREHELLNGDWDIEVEYYQHVGDGFFECDGDSCDYYDNLEDAFKEHPVLSRLDFIHGDDAPLT